MPPNALIGSRIRERRSQLRLRQADLARSAGVSAAYLNLIEHNRRRVTSDVLVRIAEALGVSAGHLEGEEAADLVAELDPMIATAGNLPLERVEDFASRFPGWARLMIAQGRRISQLEGALAGLRDGTGQKTALSVGLHELLSAATSVRSTAAILTETPDLEPEWRARFESNLAEDSARLAHGAAEIAAAIRGVSSADVPPVSAQDEVEAWLAERHWHLPEIERGVSDQVLQSCGLSPPAKALLAAWIAILAEDIRHLPLVPFIASAERHGFDPAKIAADFDCAPDRVFRRLACLPPAMPSLGLVITDGSGSLIFRKSLAGFPLPRFGAACPLWPLFAALARPGQPIEARLHLAGPQPAEVEAIAWASIAHPLGFANPPVLRGYMLLLPLPAGGRPLWRIGTSCRLCPRRGCSARREAALVALED